jgi:hypothetical protein
MLGSISKMTMFGAGLHTSVLTIPNNMGLAHIWTPGLFCQYSHLPGAFPIFQRSGPEGVLACNSV